MPPITMLIKPASSLCNMRCKYCFYADIAENRNIRSYGMMTDETLENLVKAAFEYADGSATFAFQGGEPTLAGIDFYKLLISLQKKYNKNNISVYNSIQTNGYDINEEWACFFKEQNFLVGLSLDGTKSIHDALRVDANGYGTFNRVKATAELLTKFDVEFNILCVVNNFTARHPRQVFDSLKQYKYLQFIPCLDPFGGRGDIYSLTEKRYTSFLIETFEAYYQSFLKNSPVSIRNFDNYITMLSGRPPENCGMCGRCEGYFLIEGDGTVFPCDFYVLDKWALGNINQSSLAEIAENEKMKLFKEESLFVHEKCKVCKWYPLCRGGCKRDREPFVNGNPGLNRLCGSFKEFFEYSYEKMCRMSDILGR